MMIRFILFTSMIFLVSTDDQFGISSAFLHIVTPPKQVAFTDLGEYSNNKYLVYIEKLNNIFLN